MTWVFFLLICSSDIRLGECTAPVAELVRNEPMNDWGSCAARVTEFIAWWQDPVMRTPIPGQRFVVGCKPLRGA